MLRLKIFIFLLLFLCHGNVFAQDKIVFIDLELVLKESKYGKSLLKDLENLNKKNIDKLKTKEGELKKNENDIKKKQNIISKEEFDKEVKLLKNKIKKYRNSKDLMVQDYEKKRKEILNNFFLQINPIIQNYMQENSIDILLEKKNVFIGKNNSDITDIIIEQINKNLN